MNLSPSAINTARDNGDLTASDNVRPYQPRLISTCRESLSTAMLEAAVGGAASRVESCRNYFHSSILLRCLQMRESSVMRVNKQTTIHVGFAVNLCVGAAVKMGDSQPFEVDVDTIIDSIVSPDELAYLQTLGEFFFVVDFVFEA